MTRGLAIAGKHRQEDAHKHGMGHSANLAYKKSDNPNSVRDKRKYSRMYEIVASALPWLIPDISPDAGMLRSGCPAPPLTKTGLNNPNQLKLGSRGGLQLQNVWDFVAGFWDLHGGSRVIGPIVRSLVSSLPSWWASASFGLFRLWKFGLWAIARWKRCLFSTCLDGWPNHTKDKVRTIKVLMRQVCVEMEEES